MGRVGWSVRLLVFVTVALKMMAVLTVAAPPGNLIPSLPGQPQVSFKQYSGYVTVDQSHGRKLFYYFVEAVNSSATAPLVLWLNGGPGCSSLIGAFTECGPFRADPAGNNLIVNSYAWNQVANVIFLESPAGVGFSYSNDTNDYNTDDAQTAQDSLAFLLGWLADYPEYNLTDFYITGESYAGHYIPQLAAAILKNNKVSGQPKIQLKGIMAGDPLFDPTIDLEYSVYEFAWGHGMVDEDTHDALVQYCNYTAPSLSENCSLAENTAAAESSNTYVNPYDVLVDVCLGSGEQSARLKAWHKGVDLGNVTYDPCIDDELNTYLNLNEVETAMHTEVTGWSYCSNVLNYNSDNENILMAPVLASLINSNIKVWVIRDLEARYGNSVSLYRDFSGDEDDVIPLIGTRKITRDLAKSLNLQTSSTYQPWFQGSQIGGWTVSYGSLLAFSTVRGAGHMIPQFQPARSLQLVTSFLAGDETPPLNPQ